jgi:hypothetical protein
MLFGDRPDGTVVRKAPRLRLFMPYLIRSRADAVVFFKQGIDIGATIDYLERWNDGTRPELRLFHIYMAAGVRVLGERPRLNRFIAGRRLYQRNDIAIAISVIKVKDDDAKLTVVKQTFEKDDGIRTVRDLTENAIANGRSKVKTKSERELAQAFKLPRFMLPVILKLQKFTDWLNISPAFMAESDPLYASAMISHLGSIGLDSAYHHLYDHGTLPVFVVIGKVQKKLVITERGESEIRPIVTIRYSLDERIVDGFYAARSLERLKELVENPWLLERAGDDGPGVL